MYSSERHQQDALIERTKILNGNENVSQISERYQMKSNSDSDVEKNQDDEYCFVRMSFRSSVSIKQIDELEIFLYNQTIYKGCLQDGDSFIFKSTRDSNESVYKLNIFRNNLFDNEMISCCEYGLMRDNRHDSFKIEQIIGSKPCQTCQSKRKAFPRSIVQPLNDISEKEAVNQQSAEMEALVSFTSKKTNGPPRLSPTFSSNEDSSPSTPVSSEMNSYNFFALSNQNRNTQSSNGIFQRYQNGSIVNGTIETEERTGTNANLLPTNTIFESLSNLFYDLLFGTGDHTETSSNTIRREKGSVEWFNLIYLHHSPLDSSTVQRIQRLINMVKIYDDPDDCIAYINSLSNQKMILILSDNFCDLFLPKIENNFQILSIYILSDNPQENLTFSSTQIRGVYGSIDDIYEMISNDINPAKSDLVLFESVYIDRSTLNTTFIFFQLLGDILLDRSENENAFQELIHFARQEYEGNEYELTQIEEFEKTYKSTQAISWLFRQCFLLKMLYRAILLYEVDILFKLRLFIQHLNVEIEKQTIIEPISVYLGNTIDKLEINSIEALGGNRNLITLNQFLFASTDPSHAITKAKKLSRHNEEFLNLLIRIDFPSAAKCLIRLPQNSPLNVDGIDIFINAGIMTKIITIDKDYQEKGYISMHLQFISYADETNVQGDIQVVRNEMQSTSLLFRLARLLVKVNRQSMGEQFFSNLVNEDLFINDTKRQTSISQGLEFFALIHFRNLYYKRASELFLLSLKGYHRFLPKNSSSLYETYRDLGISLSRIADYQLAIDYFQQALDTQFYSNNPNLIDSAFCCFNIGLMYFKQKNEQNAVQALDHAEKLLKQSGETHHIQLVAVYEALANNYYSGKKYDDAVIYYKKMIEVQQTIQPIDSKELCSLHFLIANIYLDQKSYSNANIYYVRSLDYARGYLPEKHYSIVLLHNNIGYTYYEEKKYSSALDHYSQGLSLAAECLSGDASLIGTLLSNKALAYSDIGKFDEAIELMEKSIAQYRKTLLDDDEPVVTTRTLLDGIKRKKILHEVIGETDQYF